MSRYLLLFFFFQASDFNLSAQNLFYEGCFVGGVTVGGAVRDGGSFEGYKCPIKWEEDYELKKAFVVCYRYGEPPNHITYINDTPVNWSDATQVGAHFFDENSLSDPYSTHVQDITESLSLNDDTLTLDFPPQSIGPNFGYWSMYVVILYESPLINTQTCLKLYTANARQDLAQSYNFNTPSYNDAAPFVLSLFTSRITFSEVDRGRLEINDELVGEVWTGDLTIPVGSNGVQGHFYYENQAVTALNGDTANTTMHRHDALAVINNYLEIANNSLVFSRPANPLPNSDNLFPAFTLAYSSDCQIVDVGDFMDNYEFCRGDSIQLNGIEGYTNYSWEPQDHLSDPTIANPWCRADSSGWYRLSMEDDSGVLCPKTLPVFVEVRQIPRPASVDLNRAVCPEANGSVLFASVAGTPPYTYALGSLSQPSGFFDDLMPGIYPVTIADDLGCFWDSTITIPQTLLQTASFNANPDSGFTPLSIVFTNTSTNTTNYAWSIDGDLISNSENLSYLFEEPGTYQVQLIATDATELCRDTASASIIVKQGLEVFIPNIISPNGDGKNDQLTASLFGVASIQWTVFNRWGEELATGSANNPEDRLVLWNPSDEVKEGSYFLVILGIGEDGNREELTTNLTLVR